MTEGTRDDGVAADGDRAAQVVQNAAAVGSGKLGGLRASAAVASEDVDPAGEIVDEECSHRDGGSADADAVAESVAGQAIRGGKFQRFPSYLSSRLRA